MKLAERQKGEVKKNEKHTELGKKESCQNEKDHAKTESEKEPCDYEKLREKNIREIEQAMAESNFFGDLKEFKLEIGLQKARWSDKTV